MVFGSCGTTGGRLTAWRWPGNRRRGVTAQDREGEREVARPEHCDGPDRDQHAPQVRAWARRRRARMVDGRFEETPFANHVGEEAELRCGSDRFAVELDLAEAGFGRCSRNKLGTLGLHAVGNCVEQRGSPVAGEARESSARNLCRLPHPRRAAAIRAGRAESSGAPACRTRSGGISGIAGRTIRARERRRGPAGPL
jgi:hypothetical protein